MKQLDSIKKLTQLKQTWIEFRNKNVESSEIIKQVEISDKLKVIKKERTLDTQNLVEQKSIQQKIFSLQI